MAIQYETGNLAALVTPNNLRTIKGINKITDAINQKLTELNLPVFHFFPSMLKYRDLKVNRHHFVQTFVNQINKIEKKVKELNTKTELKNIHTDPDIL